MISPRWLFKVLIGLFFHVSKTPGEYPDKILKHRKWPFGYNSSGPRNGSVIRNLIPARGLSSLPELKRIAMQTIGALLGLLFSGFITNQELTQQVSTPLHLAYSRYDSCAPLSHNAHTSCSPLTVAPESLMVRF